MAGVTRPHRIYDKCAYKNCTNGKHTTNSHLFRFPTSDDPRHEYWVQCTGMYVHSQFFWLFRGSNNILLINFYDSPKFCSLKNLLWKNFDRTHIYLQKRIFIKLLKIFDLKWNQINNNLYLFESDTIVRSVLNIEKIWARLR